MVVVGARVVRQNVQMHAGRLPRLATGLRAICDEHKRTERIIPAWQAEEVHLDEKPGAWILAALDAAEHNARQH